jgi:molybdopterin-guanine dinucleotide biosynthesis protein B
MRLNSWEDGLAVPVVSVVGKSGVGKTTFLEKLIRELKRRGYRVGTIKHDWGGFEIDQPGKDTWRHAQAGSDVVVISSPHKMAMIRRVDAELSLDEIVATLPPLDIVITEGFKAANKPKIEVVRSAVAHELLFSERDLLAVVTDRPFAVSVPHFGLDDAAGVAALLEDTFALRAS